MEGNKPTHRASLITEYKDGQGQVKSKFTEICAIRQTDKGHLVINIPKGMLLTGKIIVSPITTQESTGPVDDEDSDNDYPF